MALRATSGSGGGGGSGTVTTVSVVSANGLAGTVATDTTTPAITLSTSVTGVLKGNGTAISAATAGTDYQAPISLTTTGTSGAATFAGNVLNIPQYSGGGGGGTVTSVAQSFTGGIVSVAGSPVTTSGTLALTVAGTSGGIPYFSSGTTWATSAALASNALVVGGGAGVAPSTVTTGTGVVTALGVNTGTAGAFVVNGGALGTPTSGTVTNLTGTASININGTVGATTPAAGTFTTVGYKGSSSGTITFQAPAVAGTATYTLPGSDGTSGQVLSTNGTGTLSWATASGGVTTIGFGTTGLTPSAATGGVVTVAGTLVVANGGTGITSGTSGGIPYFSSASAITSSAALASNALVVGGGAGVAPSTITTGTGVVTALGVNTGTAGAFVVNGGVLGTPSSGTVTNLTGTASININGTVGATTPTTGVFTTSTARAAATQDSVILQGRAGGTSSYGVTITPTTLTASRTLTLPDASGTILQSGTTVTTGQGGTGLTSFTANGVVYASSTSALATGSAFVFDGTNLGLGVTPSAWGAGYKALELPNGSFTALSGALFGIAQNTYYNGTNWIYKTSAGVTLYSQSGSTNFWYTASSGTAGNTVSFTQAMTLDANGKLLVGTSTAPSTTSAQLSLVNSGGGGIQIGTASGGGGLINASGGSGMVFFGYTGAQGSESYSERMRIDTSGNLGIGTNTPNASALLDVQSTTKGVRMPNMTTTQKNAISSPAAGLMVFDTTLAKLCVYSGSAWQTVTSV